MQRLIHYLEDSLAKPVHPIRILVVGAGGTGSQVLNCLARMSKALHGLGHAGFHVTALDKDRVEEHNVGRQLFAESEIGLNKAISAVTKINRFMGFSWNAIDEMLTDGFCLDFTPNIIISCVDNVATRRIIQNFTFHQKAREHMPYYWMDFGNGKTIGQAILGSICQAEVKSIPVIMDMQTKDNVPHNPYLRNVFDVFPKMEDYEVESGPSCSMAEALGNQDLFINSTLANVGCHLLWKLFLNKKIDYHGVFLNMNPLDVKELPIKDKIIVQPKTKSKK